MRTAIIEGGNKLLVHHTYNHAKKIGNQGDLVKHVALLAALRHLLAQHPQGQPFVYADCHSGWPAYVLPAVGEWRYGIGEFFSKPEMKRDREARKKPEYEKNALSDYDETLIGSTLQAGSNYFGSTGIAFKVLQASGCPFEMHLWEKEKKAFKALFAHFKPWSWIVHVHHGDGYKGVELLTRCSLALLDPPSPDYVQLYKSIDTLRKKKVPFLCWATRTSKCIKDGKGSGKGVEAQASQRFSGILAPTACLKVKWHAWGHRAPGCFISCSDNLRVQVKRAVEAVCKLMGYELA